MMESNIPTFGIKKPLSSKIPAQPSSIRRPLPKAGAFTATKKLSTFSALKRPGEPLSTFSTVKFKRTTPLSLLKQRNDPHAAKNQVISRLDFSEAQPKSTLPKFSIPSSTSKHNLKKVESDNVETVKYESKSTSPIVDWSTLNKESELISFKVKTSLLQKQIDDLNCKNSKLRIDSEVEETKLKNSLKKFETENSHLSNDVLSMKENEVKLKEEIEVYKNLNLEQSDFFEKQKEEYEKTINQLKLEICELNSKEHECRSQLSSEKLSLEHRVVELEGELDRCNQEIAVYKDDPNELQNKCQLIDTLQKQLIDANNKISLLGEEIKVYKEKSALKDIFNDEIVEMKNIKNENIQMKNQLDLLNDVNSENLILKEKILGLENEIDNLNSNLNKKNVDIGKVNFFQSKYDEWVRIVGVDSPEILVNMISEMKQNVSVLKVENESLKSEIKLFKEKSIQNDSFSKVTESEVKELKNKNSELTDLIKKINRKCLLFSKEKESYKKIINSYESEITISDEHTSSRISDLESILEEYKSIMEQQEQDLKKLRETSSEIDSKVKEITELKNEIDRIKALNPCVYSNISVCDVSTLQTNEKNYRVIHLTENPLSIKINEHIQKHKTLLEENERLRCLTEMMGSGSTTQKCENCIHQRLELEKLNSDLNKALQNNAKLSETFKNISNTFRKTCYYLTGYQIDNLAQNRYRLTHNYDSSIVLEFEVNNKNILLLENSTTEKHQEKIQTYLDEHQSYPAFLASFTLELFHRQTLM